MQLNDQQRGTPQALYKGTQAAIEALTGVPEGAVAYATDLSQLGSYDGATWTWGGGGGALTEPYLSLVSGFSRTFMTMGA